MQKAIVGEFAPRFAPGSECLYVRDTIEKDLFKNNDKKNNIRKIFVIAFQNLSMFKMFSASLAWETEVWISEMSNCMIHLNGDRFMGPIA